MLNNQHVRVDITSTRPSVDHKCRSSVALKVVGQPQTTEIRHNTLAIRHDRDYRREKCLEAMSWVSDDMAQGKLDRNVCRCYERQATPPLVQVDASEI